MGASEDGPDSAAGGAGITFPPPGQPGRAQAIADLLAQQEEEEAAALAAIDAEAADGEDEEAGEEEEVEEGGAAVNGPAVTPTAKEEEVNVNELAAAREGPEPEVSTPTSSPSQELVAGQEHRGQQQPAQQQQQQKPDAGGGRDLTARRISSSISLSSRSPEPPPEFIDPISDEIMQDPVVLTESGQTYERAVIERWFQTCEPRGQCRDPLTGTVLTTRKVVPNYALKRLIFDWAERHSIRDISEYSKQHSPLRQRLTTAAASSAAVAAAAVARMRLSSALEGAAGPPAGGDSTSIEADTAPEASYNGEPAPGRAPSPLLDGGPPAGQLGSEEGDKAVNNNQAARQRLANTTPGEAAADSGMSGGAAAAAAPAAAAPAAGAPSGPASYPQLFGAPPAAPRRPATSAGAGAGKIPPPATARPSPYLQQQTLPTEVVLGAGGVYPSGRPGGGVYPSAERPARTAQDKLRDVDTSLQALQPAQLVSGGKGAAAYHSWTLMQLAAEAECKTRMLQSRVIPLAVYLLGQPDMGDAKASLAGLLQRLSVVGPPVATEILMAGGVHALALLAGGSDDRKQRVAAANSLYFMGWLTEQIRGTAAATLAQQAQQQKLPPNPLYALWRFWEEDPPRPPPGPSQQPVAAVAGGGGAGGAAAEADPAWEGTGAVCVPAPVSTPTPQVPQEQQEEWEALAFITHMLSSGPGAAVAAAAGPASGATPVASLDVRATSIPQVLTHVAASGCSEEAAQYAALSSMHALMRLPQNRAPLLVPLLEAFGGGDWSLAGSAVTVAWFTLHGLPAVQNRAPLLAPLLEALGGGDWSLAGSAATVLWELAYDEAMGNNFLTLQALHSAPPFIPALLSALACPHPSLRRPATGLLACILFDGAGLAASGSSAAAVNTQRYLMVDSWRQALLASGSPTLRLLLESARDAVTDPQLAQLSLTALANLAAARGTAAAHGGSPATPPQPKPNALDKALDKVKAKLKEAASRPGQHGGSPGGSPGGGSAGGSFTGSHEGRPVAPGPRGAILWPDAAAIPTLLHLVVNPAAPAPPAPSYGGAGDGLAASLGAGGSGTFGSGSLPSLSPPGTPGSAVSSATNSSFSFTPIGQLSGGGPGAADTQGIARIVLPPALLALGNLVTEQAGREQVRAWAKGQGRHAQLQTALSTAMSNKKLPPQAQELARRLLHELSSVPGPLQKALAGRPVPPPPRAAAYPTP
ncbi:hypothetical protein N2152v2_010468 [Parachlorella kessleri]